MKRKDKPAFGFTKCSVHKQVETSGTKAAFVQQYGKDLIQVAAFFTPIIPIEPMKATLLEQIPASSQQQNRAIGFGDILSQTMQQVEQAQQASRQDAVQLGLGDVDNLAQVQINAMKSATMLQTATQLTSRAVNAYKEIMQMQV